MSKQPGCVSPAGLLVALLVIVGVVGYSLLNGGGLFSPGPVTASHPRNTLLDGYESHTAFENQCTQCHRPWQGADPQRCLACHTGVRDQFTGHEGLHGQLQNPDECILCHTEHQGRDANISAAAVPNYPHQQVGFSLAGHRRRADGQPFACADCHLSIDRSFDRASCEDCHTELDAGFMVQHVADFARDCLQCHDGSGAMAGFDHEAVFALKEAHASLVCTDCHVDGKYKGLSSECVACHEEPDVHQGQFGLDCQACHTVQAWTPARLLQHAFPLDHGSRTELECQVCHPGAYVVYTCYDCHEHNQQETQREHLEEGISDFEDCVDCHPTGREGEGERGVRDED